MQAMRENIDRRGFFSCLLAETEVWGWDEVWCVVCVRDRFLYFIGYLWIVRIRGDEEIRNGESILK